jgi:predicted transcriptional regulator
MSTTLIKEEAHRIIDQLPAGATWADLKYQIYVRESIEKGLQDIAEGRIIRHEDVLKHFGL